MGKLDKKINEPTKDKVIYALDEIHLDLMDLETGKYPDIENMVKRIKTIRIRLDEIITEIVLLKE